MHRFWSLIFFSIPVLGTLYFVLSMLGVPPFSGHWLPTNINEYGDSIDHLFYLILIITGIVFIGTGIALGWFLWKYAESENQGQAHFVHGNIRAELIWSVIPGIILLFISFYQVRPWVAVTLERPTIEVDGVKQPKPPIAKVVGRQFNWDVRYPGPDGKLDTVDDLLIVDTVFAVPADEEVVLQVEAEDVLHSFFIPKMRLKQDVVPGRTQFVWFKARKAEDCEIACTELCGWGHYKMKAKMTVLPREEYDAWLEARYAEFHQTQLVQD